MNEEFWSVAVESPLHQLFTYKASPQLKLAVGQQVLIPFGPRKIKGVLVAPTQAEVDSKFEIKSIIGRENEYFQIPVPYMEWARWMSQYYLYPLGGILSLMLPPPLKISNRVSKKKSPLPDEPLIAPFPLTSQQKDVFFQMQKQKGFAPQLLFGVTGSGKTEVYLELIAAHLARGESALFLVPEISLTPQLLQRFVRRFGQDVAVIHSQLSPREKAIQWWDILQGRKKILVGARSALFCPVPKLGLIVLDEEHEPSFKQDEKFRYHGRDCAVMLARHLKIPIVLGSATPSLETWKNAVDGRYQIHRLPDRIYTKTSLPDFQVIDLRHQRRPAKPADVLAPPTDLPEWMSPILYTALEKNLKNNFQAALFLNRRGAASVTVCGACGYIAECPNCDIKLTLHGQRHLVCHYCDYQILTPEECPSCKDSNLKALGLGTEQIETDLKRLFPVARVARADRDEIQNREDMENLVKSMDSGQIDLLVGTQMIAKGLDFKRLNLVALVLADIGFSMPDFRSTERSYQLISQMAGRAGRHHLEGSMGGEVWVQTYNPDHPSLQFALRTDFEGFAKQELELRKELSYPPFGRMISIKIQSLDRMLLLSFARTLQTRSQKLMEQHFSDSALECLGPVEAPIAKLRGQFRMHMLLKAADSKRLHAFIRMLLGDMDWVPSKVKLTTDVDPLNLL